MHCVGPRLHEEICLTVCLCALLLRAILGIFNRDENSANRAFPEILLSILIQILEGEAYEIDQA